LQSEQCFSKAAFAQREVFLMLVEVQVASGPRIDQKTAYRVLFQLQATRIQQKKVLHEGRAIRLQLEGVLVWAERLGKVITTWKLLVKLPPLILVFRRHGKLQKSNQELVYRSTKIRYPAFCNQIHIRFASSPSIISAQCDWRKKKFSTTYPFQNSITSFTHVRVTIATKPYRTQRYIS